MQRLTPKEAAQIIGYSVSTMKHWRRGKKVWEPGLPGPRFFSIHGRIFYSREALEDWERLCGSARDIMVRAADSRAASRPYLPSATATLRLRRKCRLASSNAWRNRCSASVRLWNRLSSRHCGLNMVSELRPRSDTA